MSWTNDTATPEQQAFLDSVRDALETALMTDQLHLAAEKLHQLAGLMLHSVWNEQGRPQPNLDATSPEDTLKGLSIDQMNVILGGTVHLEASNARSMLKTARESRLYDTAASLYFLLGLTIGEVSPRMREALTSLAVLSQQRTRQAEGGKKSGHVRTKWHAKAQARFEETLTRRPWLADQPATRVVEKMLEGGWRTEAKPEPLLRFVREQLKLRNGQPS